MLAGDLNQHLQLLVLATIAQADFNLDVVFGRPGGRVHLNKFVAKANDLLLRHVFDDAGKDQLCEVFAACLREYAGDHFDFCLSSLHRCRYRCCGCALQHVRVEAHAGSAHARALIAQTVHVLKHRECLLPDLRNIQRRHHAGGSGSDNAARARLQ